MNTVNELLQEIADLKMQLKVSQQAVRYEQWLDGRQGTHSEGCWNWGPAHYRCAINHIAKLEEGNKK